jgi:predicted membrane protein
MERIDVQPTRTNNSRLIFGLVLITVGLFLFADRFDLIPFEWNQYIFTWQSLLIVIGLVSLGKGESRVTGLVLISIGGLFLAAKVLGYHYPIKYFFWPTVFVAIGLILIFHSKGHMPRFGMRKGIIDVDFIDDMSIFGGSEQRVSSKNFRGGRVTNIFGGSTFFMGDAQLAPGRNVLDMFCLFGGSKIVVPSDWKIKIEVTSIFGGYADKRMNVQRAEGAASEKELVIRGVVIFGGGEIKSY